ncbi:hypothetical protein JCM11251_003846 [Rhodosporidiobolus azoricus]
MSIQAIDRSSVHRLTSGQVVIDLQTAVKELIENALDAGATSLKVTFRDHGLEAIEVEDNGKGIEKEDWPGIALKHHTSKLTSFSDLATVSTLGFRGEALSSLCGTAKLSMVTSTHPTLPVGTSLTFTHSGECVVGGKVARNRGTTVKVEKLFDNLPVRRKELQKNAKREFGKALELLQAYAIINTGVRFEVKNAMKGKQAQTQLQTPVSATVRSTFGSIYQPKALTSLLDLDLTLDVATDKSVLKRIEGASEGSTRVRVKGLISKPSSPHGRTASNRQFYYVNGRPFSPTKIAKTFNEVYRTLNAQQFPTVVADFQLAPDAYDVNVSPDKRTIFLHSEGNLLAALKAALTEFFAPSQSTYAMAPIAAPVRKASSSSNASPMGTQAEKVQVKEEGQEEREDKEAEERPRKRRKSSPAPDIGEEQEKTPAPADISMDVELDATIFSSPPRQSSSSTAGLVDPTTASIEAFLPSSALSEPFPQLDDEDIALPLPPSPLRRKYADGDLDSGHGPSSDSGLGLQGDEEREEDQLVMQSEAGPSSPRRPPPPGSPSSPQPLFRSSPSPLPPSPSHAPETDVGTFAFSARSRTRTHSPFDPPKEPLVPPNLKQPILSFAPPPPPHVKGKSRSKEKGKGKAIEPAKKMASQLLRFRRGATGTPAPPVADEEGEENMVQDVEQESEEEMEQVDELEAGEGEGGVREEEEMPVADDTHLDILLDDGRVNAEIDPTMQLDLEPPSVTTAKDLPGASCTCVHGSQHADADEADSDLEIMEAAEKEAVAPAPAPFGSAPTEVAGTVVAADTTLAFDLEGLEAQWSASSLPSPASTPPKGEEKAKRKRRRRGDEDDEEYDPLAGAGIGEREAEAEATLSRVVTKEDFEAMEVLGQFNLGFIIARRRIRIRRAGGGDVAEEVKQDGEEVQDDLFIVDQHASDEKYNFETLQAETVIQSQRLIAPRTLNLPAHDEITAMEHLDILRLNGFDVLIDEEANVGERVKLLAQPVSKDTVFDVGDFEELLDLISSRSGNEVVRPSKARRMFASRACRKSVMIGKALNVKQMTQIVRHMGGMDQPWACPHGRPTMRWLRLMSIHATYGHCTDEIASTAPRTHRTDPHRYLRLVLCLSPFVLRPRRLAAGVQVDPSLPQPAQGCFSQDDALRQC